MKVLKAKPIKVSDDIIKKLNKSGKGNLDEILVEMGVASRRHQFYLAAGIMSSFDRLLDIGSKLNPKSREKYDLENVATLLQGLAVMYVLGSGFWDTDNPVPQYVPAIPNDIFAYDKIITRSGKEYEPIEFMDTLMEYMGDDQVKPVYYQLFKRKLSKFGKRQGISVVEVVKLLTTTFELCDDKM